MPFLDEKFALLVRSELPAFELYEVGAGIVVSSLGTVYFDRSRWEPLAPAVSVELDEKGRIHQLVARATNTASKNASTARNDARSYLRPCSEHNGEQYQGEVIP